MPKTKTEKEKEALKEEKLLNTFKDKKVDEIAAYIMKNDESSEIANALAKAKGNTDEYRKILFKYRTDILKDVEDGTYSYSAFKTALQGHGIPGISKWRADNQGEFLDWVTEFMNNITKLSELDKKEERKSKGLEERRSKRAPTEKKLSMKSIIDEGGKVVLGRLPNG